MPDEPTKMTVSHRDAAALETRLGAWLDRHEPGSTITSFARPTGNGMSSETILLDVASGAGSRRLVARIAAADDDIPVFPDVDLDAQVAVLGLLDQRSDVPVPKVRWNESDASAIGSPFFVMERIDGRVPADNPPYTFEGWLLDASPAERQSLQDDMVWVLGGIHGADVTLSELSFLEYDLPGFSALHRNVEWWRRYYRKTHAVSVPIVDEAFSWLDAHWPADDGGPSVLSWGDARIGNVIFDGFRPVGILDWEMAALGPRGLDLGWISFIHLFFQDIAELMGLPGIPGFFQPDDVAETYALRTAVEVDMQFWLVYAALRYAVVLGRVNQRMVAFGEARQSDDPEAAIMFLDLFRRTMR